MKFDYKETIFQLQVAEQESLEVGVFLVIWNKLPPKKHGWWSITVDQFFLWIF